jgi:hypothetical protein
MSNGCFMGFLIKKTLAGADMKKLVCIFGLLLIFNFLLVANSFAIATLGGTIVSINLPEKQMVIVLRSGAQRTIMFEDKCIAYKFNQSAHLSQFKPGDYVVIKISSPLNYEPMHAEIVMDEISARSYVERRTIVPMIRPSGGGFATTAGAASRSVVPLTGAYINAVTPPPGVTAVERGTNPAMDAFSPVGTAPGTVAPSPWGSPAMASVISPPPESTPGMGYSPNPPAAGSSPPQTTGGWGDSVPGVSVVPTAHAESTVPSVTSDTNNYNTPPPNLLNPANTDWLPPPSISDVESPVGSAPPPTVNQNNSAPGQTWIEDTTQSASVHTMISVQGDIVRIDGTKNLLQVKENEDAHPFNIIISKNTTIVDLETNKDIKVTSLKPGTFVIVSGLPRGGNQLEAFIIRVAK